MTAAGVETLSAVKRSLLEQRLHGSRPRREGSDAIAPRANPGPSPLTAAQRQLWYHTRLAPSNPVYNEAVIICKLGSFDHAAFRRAFSAIHASCSRVVPNSWKWRDAIIAIQFAADAAPYGIVHCMKPPMRGSLPLSMLTLLPTPIPARPPLPWAVPSPAWVWPAAEGTPLSCGASGKCVPPPYAAAHG